MSQNLSFHYVSVSQQSSAQQSGVATTTGEDASEALDISWGPTFPKFPTHQQSCQKMSLTVISDEDDPILKNMIDEEYKQLEQEQKDREKCKLEIKRDEAREKAALLWQIRKQLEEQKVAEEKRKQQVLQEQEEGRWKQQEEKAKAAKE